MSAESRRKAEEHGQRSGKGTQLLSRALGLLSRSDEDTDD